MVQPLSTNIDNKEFGLGWVKVLGSDENFGLSESIGLRCQGVKSLGSCWKLNFEIWVYEQAGNSILRFGFMVSWIKVLGFIFWVTREVLV